MSAAGFARAAAHARWSGRTATGQDARLPDFHRKVPDIPDRATTGKWKGPVIIAIEEAQRLPRDRTAKHTLFCQFIKMGGRNRPGAKLQARAPSTIAGAEGITGFSAIGIGKHMVTEIYR